MTHFNSSMVRLKVASIYEVFTYLDIFQFLDGAIKRHILLIRNRHEFIFQFLDGAIKSVKIDDESVFFE